MKLENKVALITGAGRGIGKTTSLLFAKEGASIVVNDIDDTCKNTVETIKNMGGKATAIMADVSKSSEVQRMVDQAVKKYGKIDILFNNAGIEMHGVSALEKTTEKVWDNHMNNNLKSIFLCCKYVVPHMLERDEGVIINNGSIDGIFGFKNKHIAYNTSKAGVIMFTKVLAQQMRGKIRVNCICPDAVEGTRIYNRTPEAIEAEKLTPYGRVTTREEVARLALFLAADEVPFLQGVIIPLDGGSTA